MVIPRRRYHGSLVVKPDVGELGAGEHRRGLGGGIAPGVGDVDAGDGGQLAVAEQGALRLAGGARREHEGHRPFGVVVERRDRLGSPERLDLVGRCRARGRRRRRALTAACSGGASRGFTPAVMAPTLAAAA